MSDEISVAIIRREWANILHREYGGAFAGLEQLLLARDEQERAELLDIMRREHGKPYMDDFMRWLPYHGQQAVAD